MPEDFTALESRATSRLISPHNVLAPEQRSLTPRSLAIGLAGVIFICGLTPYNDYVVNNTYFVGNFLPVGLLLFFLLIVFLVNGPLSRWLPRWALTRGELTLAMGMALVSCCLPSSGLMRYLPPTLTNIPFQASLNLRYDQLLRQLDLPTWLMPTLQGSDAASRALDPAIRGYVDRIAADSDTFVAHWQAVPWAAWLVPAISWGILLGALFLAIFCLAVIVRRQWVENERLPFPLVTVYAALIEPPEPGRAFNSLFLRRSFWVAAGAVFVVHGINALHAYLPTYVPSIPLRYDMSDVFVNEPWDRVGWWVKSSAIYFSVVGIAYFVQTSVGFSLWFFILLIQVINLALGKYQMQTTVGMQSDQLFGGLIAFAATALWIGRGHWALVLRHMLGRRRAADPQDVFLPYSVAGWGLIAACGIMIGWLLMAGASVVGALVLVGMLLLMMMALARVIAETGLPFAGFTGLTATKPWTLLAGMGEGMARTTNRSFFLTALTGAALVRDMREASSVYITHALRLADTGSSTNVDEAGTPVGGAERAGRPSRCRWGVIAALPLALLAGYIVSGASTLFCEYRYASTLDHNPKPINSYGSNTATVAVLDPAVEYTSASNNQPHSPAKHLLLGATVTAGLGTLRLLFAAWPFHPVGYLMAYTYPMYSIWFSLMIGGLAKMFTLRLGGSRGFAAARPFFLGLIVGEAAAAAFWLVMSLLFNEMGLSYHPVKLLPG